MTFQGAVHAPSICLERIPYCRELKHTPNECKHATANTRSCNRTCDAETLGCRQGKLKAKRVYTLPRFPGVYNNMAQITTHHHETGCFTTFWSVDLGTWVDPWSVLRFWRYLAMVGCPKRWSVAAHACLVLRGTYTTVLT